ncbi:Hypp9043 [Branchiostoma lanceolatum]|uniref:Hypp9043 protein n=1 Tax=Branchiostoma lanceolatum TaxID=7740 RepID=A0A8J9ZCU1_BRALA|nr:Hypp9043 [Branchiostoma lanceolatum]
MAKMILLLLAVFVSAAIANRRTCFCDIRTGIDRSDPVLKIDVGNPSYRRFWGISCNYAQARCPEDCKNSAANALRGSVNPLDHAAGVSACNELRRQVIPDNPVHLYAHYRTSNCGHEGYQYLGELCCWKIDFGPYFDYPLRIQYLYNPGCSTEQHPLSVIG